MSYLDEVKYTYRRLMAEKKAVHPASKRYARLDTEMRRLRQSARVAHRTDEAMRERRV